MRIGSRILFAEGKRQQGIWTYHPEATVELVFVKPTCSLIFRACPPSASWLQILHLVYLFVPFTVFSLEQRSPTLIVIASALLCFANVTPLPFAYSIPQVCATSNLRAKHLSYSADISFTALRYLSNPILRVFRGTRHFIIAYRIFYSHSLSAEIMKVTTIASVLCLAATQLVAADTVTSTATNTITKTVYRVTAQTAAESLPATPLGSSAASTGSVASSHAHHASTASGSSASTASPSVTLSSAAGVFDANMPVALVAGSVAVLLGYL
ncbi:hypothetical protein BDV37DRAFT_264355 [Aspergillus pseudonomiae]|uniref:Uncharacterized protein n=1 Tax=Aspergillus pseudonomiae TaxID=1506151 RepID=A0A5N7CWB5_9EURO|nr:uncharacterized protein BDV37DRAFT_264355 [Aspergillus pseudonomiae]KAE8398047.1 hypothetical protein BDV37DRAFT_264355 [Aspergillus pseudonomiae]